MVDGPVHSSRRAIGADGDSARHVQRRTASSVPGFVGRHSSSLSRVYALDEVGRGSRVAHRSQGNSQDSVHAGRDLDEGSGRRNGAGQSDIAADDPPFALRSGRRSPLNARTLGRSRCQVGMPGFALISAFFFHDRLRQGERSDSDVTACQTAAIAPRSAHHPPHSVICHPPASHPTTSPPAR